MLFIIPVYCTIPAAHPVWQVEIVADTLSDKLTDGGDGVYSVDNSRKSKVESVKCLTGARGGCECIWQVVGKGGLTMDAATSGMSFGAAMAIAISWSANHSILWAILHGVFGWVYVIYYAICH